MHKAFAYGSENRLKNNGEHPTPDAGCAVHGVPYFVLFEDTGFSKGRYWVLSVNMILTVQPNFWSPESTSIRDHVLTGGHQ